MTIVRHVIIRGRVQGVGYRTFVEYEAMRCRLVGWVRNRRDGTVEALFEGEAEAVAGIIEACRKGPLGARVDALYQRDATADDLALRRQDAFAVLPTV